VCVCVCVCVCVTHALNALLSLLLYFRKRKRSEEDLSPPGGLERNDTSQTVRSMHFICLFYDILFSQENVIEHFSTKV